MQPEELALTLVDGVPADQVPADDRGLAYGDGLFETLRVSSGRAMLLDLHLQRLERGAVQLRLPVEPGLIESEICAVASRLGEGVLKLTVTRGSGPRGYRIPTEASSRRIIQTGPLPAGVTSRQRDGVSLYVCQTRLAMQPMLAGVKHLNRLEQVLGRSEWDDDDFAEGLMCDGDGNLVEGTMSNLFLRIGGGWVTPDLTRCGIAGVLREHLLRVLREAGEVVTIRRVPADELGRCTEIFCCNSIIGIWPVISAAGHHWPIGPATRDAQRLTAPALESGSL